MNITIQNEIINYINSGARVDFFYYRGVTAAYEIEMVDSPTPAITNVVIKVYMQRGGELIKTWTIAQPADNGFVFTIIPADLSANKLLNYWIDAVDQNNNILFYGSFTLQ